VAAAGITEAAVNLGASVALALVMGPIGVAFGTLAGAMIVQVPWIVTMSCRASDITLRRFATEALVPHVVPGALTAAVLIGGRALLSDSTAHLLILSAVAMAVYAGVYFTVGATPAERRRISGALAALRLRVTKRSTARARDGSPQGPPIAGPDGERRPGRGIPPQSP
jgi:peptidoglycan biosynthesis protein MviN/MurJ (putative lipid II flippase)